jgi:hypothetical protein
MHPSAKVRKCSPAAAENLDRSVVNTPNSVGNSSMADSFQTRCFATRQFAKESTFFATEKVIHQPG